MIQAGNRDYNFLPGTRRLRRKGPFLRPEISGRLCRRRIAISINLIRLRAAGIRSLARAQHKGDPSGSTKAISKNLIGLRATGIRSLARAQHKGVPPVRRVAIGAAGPWDPLRPAPAFSST